MDTASDASRIRKVIVTTVAGGTFECAERLLGRDPDAPGVLRQSPTLHTGCRSLPLRPPPRQLRLIYPQRQCPPLGIDRAVRSAAQFAEVDDLAVLDTHIAAEGRHARAIDDKAILDQQVIRHRFPFLRSGRDT